MNRCTCQAPTSHLSTCNAGFCELCGFPEAGMQLLMNTCVFLSTSKRCYNHLWRAPALTTTIVCRHGPCQIIAVVRRKRTILKAGACQADSLDLPSAAVSLLKLQR